MKGALLRFTASMFSALFVVFTFMMVATTIRTVSADPVPPQIKFCGHGWNNMACENNEGCTEATGPCIFEGGRKPNCYCEKSVTGPGDPGGPGGP